MKKRIAWIVLTILLACLLGGCGGEKPFSDVPNPVATIELSNGKSMRFELFVQDAPNTVANFIELANDGFYDGMQFFRVVPGALVQSGDPTNTGTGSAGYTIQGEFSANGIENPIAHTRGTISMARQSGNDTASCQFFIMLGNYPEYNGQYAAFGRAMDEESLSALDEIASVVVDGNYYPVGNVAKIQRIRVETHGYKYEAAKIEPSENEEDKQ